MSLRRQALLQLPSMPLNTCTPPRDVAPLHTSWHSNWPARTRLHPRTNCLGRMWADAIGEGAQSGALTPLPGCESASPHVAERSGGNTARCFSTAGKKRHHWGRPSKKDASSECLPPACIPRPTPPHLRSDNRWCFNKVQ